jgi:hypothetical protein
MRVEERLPALAASVIIDGNIHAAAAVGTRKFELENWVSIYKRGHAYWIQYYRRGRPFQESSRSRVKKVAESLLKKREGEIAVGKMPGIVFDRGQSYFR